MILEIKTVLNSYFTYIIEEKNNNSRERCYNNISNIILK
nr:MAG TPA: hypothetical protein [Caudoviricetes sp.]